MKLRLRNIETQEWLDLTFNCLENLACFLLGFSLGKQIILRTKSEKNKRITFIKHHNDTYIYIMDFLSLDERDSFIQGYELSVNHIIHQLNIQPYFPQLEQYIGDKESTNI